MGTASPCLSTPASHSLSTLRACGVNPACGCLGARWRQWWQCCRLGGLPTSTLPDGVGGTALLALARCTKTGYNKLCHQLALLSGPQGMGCPLILCGWPTPSSRRSPMLHIRFFMLDFYLFLHMILIHSNDALLHLDPFHCTWQHPSSKTAIIVFLILLKWLDPPYGSCHRPWLSAVA